MSQVKENSVLIIKKFSSFYLPKKNDLVVGTVKVRTSETFILDIGAPLDATLGAL